MHDLTLLKDNRKLSRNEMTIAKQICDEAYESVVERAVYITEYNVDKEFALPAGNWSFEAPNEFMNLFKRITKANELDINRLRFFTPMFSGYSLFEVTAAAGLTASDICFREDIDQTLAIKLSERNSVFVDEHHRLIVDLPNEFIFRPPNMLGEIGHMVNGVLVNNDTNTYQERIKLIWECGLGDLIRSRIEENGEIKALEIGGGYGALAYWFKSAFPNASYTIIDLPESLVFSMLYLSLTRPDIKTGFGLNEIKYGVRFLANYMAEQLDDSFDLIINTLSMSEMTEYQVRKYIHLIKTSWLKKGGVFFEQNHDNTHINLLFAQQLFMSEFSYRTVINRSEALRNGHPNAWSNDSVILHDKRRPAPTEVLPGPRLVESRDGFNIVSYKGKNWVIDQSVGGVDFHDQEQLKRLAASGQLLEAETMEEARATADRMRIEEASPPRIVESRDGCNIVSYKEKSWVIEQSLGSVDFRDQEQLRRLAASGELFEAETMDEARAAADRMRVKGVPRIVESRDGFNIVSYKEKSWVVDQSVGNVDFRDQEQLRRLADSSGLFEAATMDEAKAAIDRMRKVKRSGNPS